jgi:hypothetical protein
LFIFIHSGGYFVSGKGRRFWLAVGAMELKNTYDCKHHMCCNAREEEEAIRVNRELESLKFSFDIMGP